MAITVTLDNPDRLPIRGDQSLVSGTVTFDTASYVAGGTAITAAQLGGDTVVRVIFQKSTFATCFAAFDKANLKVQLFRDVATGPVAEHTAAAVTAQSHDFIAIVRKAA